MKLYKYLLSLKNVITKQIITFPHCYLHKYNEKYKYLPSSKKL